MQLRTLPAIALLTGIGFAAQAQPLPPQLTYVQPLSRSAVQTVQERLRQAGDYTGHVDGIWGPDSVVALQRYQQTHGLQVTGQLNQATAATMGLNIDALLGTSQPATAPATPPVPTPAAVSPDQVRAVQGKLREMGFYHGALDGVWGPETQEAIARFQQSRGLEANSQLNPATLGALGFQPALAPAR
ncbi:MAG TPA: peptidoglycan-binding domain-containing protein [Acetobacteraceae bacterium]|nr:peptidoglycan-binding domain-containing protein [Acetobacteraceae bacterium]